MQRLELTEDGQQFIKSMQVCLNWLALGGEIKTKSGYTLVMDNDGQPGFKVWSVTIGYPEGIETVYQIGSDTAWMSLVEYAQGLKEKDLTAYAASLALSQMERL